MHFIGVLFGGNLDHLEPYYEGLEVEPYVRYTKEEIIQDFINRRNSEIKWRKERIQANDSRSSEYQLWLKDHPKHTKRTAWKEVKFFYEGCLDKDGNVLSTCNPDSQWDWYAIGGRWSEYFPLKEKDEVGNPLYTNEATVGEVDWDFYFEEHHGPYCYITEDGVWVSKGEIGWFTSTNEMTIDDWTSQFKREINKYAEDTPIIAVDFHI